MAITYPMIPPDLHRMLVSIAGKRPPGPLLISAALVGSWTRNELLTFGFTPAPGGMWQAPAEWRASWASHHSPSA